MKMREAWQRGLCDCRCGALPSPACRAVTSDSRERTARFPVHREPAGSPGASSGCVIVLCFYFNISKFIYVQKQIAF